MSLFVVHVILLSHLALAARIPSLNSSTSNPENSAQTLSHNLPIKRSTDCGTWTMYCGGIPLGDGSGRGDSAEGACNNACYYINNIDNDFVAKYKTDTDNDKNRAQSGCTTQQGSVCNLMPFSQRFHDPFENVPQDNPNDYKYNCDEFPMAAMSQLPFGSDGRPPNSLRCIDSQQNSAMGAQLGFFIRGIGAGLEGRTCEGQLPDDATFKIAFNYDGADLSQLGFCTDLPGGVTPPKDPYYQFYMTQLQGGPPGQISMPHRPSTDNHYSIGSTNKDVLECSVVVNRDTGGNYKAAVRDGWGTGQGSASKRLVPKGDPLIVPGQNGLLDLAILVNDPPGDRGTVGSEILFNYGASTDFELGTNYFFTTLSQGTDTHLSNWSPDVTLPGGYCTVPNIDPDGTQQLRCFFPCNAA